mmetsp:Transcript_3489/g.13509  ORF Transcript_3489/g.13509 Transcript_3489/m.13509 type:complete len:235 (-) Transcript_3489:2031-2735(-)
MRRSVMRFAAPYEMRQSRSISPSRRPPSRDRLTNATLRRTPTKARAHAPLGRLARKLRARAAGTRVHLVHDHVLELLVEERAVEDVGLHRRAAGARVEHVFAYVGEAVGDEGLGRGARRVGRAAVLAERGAVGLAAGEDAGLAGDELDDLADSHAAREAVRVHDEVGADAGVGERHVLLRDDRAADALLAVPRGELVADLGPAALPDHDLDEELVGLVRRERDAVDDRRRGAFV